MEPTKANYLHVATGAVIGVVVGALGGYFLGSTLAIESINKQIAAQEKANEAVPANPYANIETNPLENVKTNPYEGVKTNPFE